MRISLKRAAVIFLIVGAIAAFVGNGLRAVTVGAGVLGGFENEGNLIVDDATAKDWANASNLTPVIDDTSDSGFQGSSKELKPSTWVCNTGGANPGKGNLLRAYLNTEIVNDKSFLNLAWVRENASGQGDVHVNYEFNQHGTAHSAPTSGSCPITRSENDLIVTYDFDGGGSLPHINLYRWQPHASLTSQEDGTWIDMNLPASAARAAVNASTITDSVAGGSVLDLRFGEVTIDLTAALTPPGGTPVCRHFGVANIRSRSSGESWTSALQDNLPGIPVDVSTCPGVPSLTTTAMEEVFEGNPISDVAHLSGGKSPLTGGMTFRAYGPDDENCTVEPAFVATMPVNGPGNYTSTPFNNPAPGTYRWVAKFISDNLSRNENVSGACNDPGETSVVIPVEPGLSLDKKVNGGDHKPLADALVVHKGDEVDYSVAITNTGNVPLTISALEDTLHADLAGACDHGNGFVLEPDGTINCAYTDTIAAPAHNVASVTGTPSFGSVATASDETFVKPIDPKIAIVKDGTLKAHAGDAVSYSFAVSNTGDIELTNVSVDDDKLGHIGDITHLAVGESKTLEFETVAPSDDVKNTATGCGFDPLALEVCASDDHSLDVIHPAIDVTKTASPDQAHEGDEVVYSFAVHNGGDVDLTDVTVTDDVYGDIGTIDTLAVDETKILTKTVSAPAADTRNVATACGFDPLQSELCDDDDHAIDIVHPGIDVTKSADVDAAHEGDKVTYTFSVHNTGDVALAPVTVADDVLGEIATIPSLAGDATAEFTKTMTVPASTEAVDNTVTACGLDPLEQELCDSDIHHLPVIHPAITIDKTVAGADHKPESDALLAHEGDDLGYTVVVTNTGDTALEITALSDVVDGALDDCSQGAGSTLEPGAVITCAYTTTAEDDHHNVVFVTGVDSLGGDKGTVSATDDTFVNVIDPAIEIVKTADPVSVEPGLQTTYTYAVTNTGDTALTDVLVTDDILGTIGTIDSLAPGETKTLTKTVTIAADSPRTNIGTACGLDAIGREVCDTDDETISIVLPLGPEGRRLPATGFRVLLWVAFATTLIAAGLAMIQTQRRSPSA